MEFIKKVLIFVFVFGLVACSSKERIPEDVEHEDLKRDYLVRDSSSKFRPGWIEDPEVWAKKHGKNLDTYRFFSYETEPKVARNIGCNLAKANVKSDIAGEITTFIDKSLAVSQEGDASIDENNPNVRALREFVENTLAEKIQALIHGAAIVKTYWEKRAYQADLGAKKDFTGFTCAVFIRMSSKRLAKAVQDAADFVAKSTDDPETKENVKKALKDVSKNFIKARTGEI